MDQPLKSGRRDLNPRRPPWQGGTLPLSYSRERRKAVYRSHGSSQQEISRFFRPPAWGNPPRLGRWQAAMRRARHDMTAGAHDMTAGAHDMTRARHEMTRGAHEMTRCPHGMTAGAHDMTRAPHGMTRAPHGMTAGAHEMTAGAHGMTAGAHGVKKFELWVAGGGSALHAFMRPQVA